LKRAEENVLWSYPAGVLFDVLEGSLIRIEQGDLLLLVLIASPARSRLELVQLGTALCFVPSACSLAI